MEVHASGRPDLKGELDRIEAAVAAGSTDLRSLGFWRLVRQVKRDRALIAAHADQIGRIDTAAFRARVRLRVPVWLGNLALVLAVVAGGIAVWAAFAWKDPLWKGLALVAAGGIWSLGLHSPTHWFVGWLVGIRWTDYFLGGPPPPRPGLKSDYATYLRADPGSRAWMHASGAIATKLAPFIALAFWPGSGAPAWAAWALLALGRVGDRDRRAVQHEEQRLDEVPARAGGLPGQPSGVGPGSRELSGAGSSPGRPVGCAPWIWCVWAT